MKSKPESMMSECSGKIQRKSCLCPASLQEVVQASAKNVNRLRAVRGQLARQASRLLCTSATYYASMRARANSAHFAKGSKLLRIEKMQLMESVNLLYCLENINQCILGCIEFFFIQFSFGSHFFLCIFLILRLIYFLTFLDLRPPSFANLNFCLLMGIRRNFNGKIIRF